MNRRAFLSLVAAGVTAEVAERLLWVPKPMITVPAMPTQWMAPNGLAWDPKVIAAMAQELADQIDRAGLDRLYGPFVAPGETITMRLPHRYEVTHGVGVVDIYRKDSHGGLKFIRTETQAGAVLRVAHNEQIVPEMHYSVPEVDPITRNLTGRRKRVEFARS